MSVAFFQVILFWKKRLQTLSSVLAGYHFFSQILHKLFVQRAAGDTLYVMHSDIKYTTVVKGKKKNWGIIFVFFFFS